MTDPNIATEKTGTVEANGLSIGYSTRGSGPPLVLIHGAEAGREMFAAFAPELAAHFTVIAYDQRDTGSTRDLTIPPRDYGLADLGDDVAELIKRSAMTGLMSSEHRSAETSPRYSRRDIRTAWIA
jgi:alpha-beta hydrolase superfamily lysophospholipase